MTWFAEFLLRADASRRGRRASIRRSPGDTVQYNINGQLMNVVIPPNLKAGDTFEVSVPVAIPTVAAIPAAPPPPRTPITEAEALCYNLRHSVMCYAILDACLAFLNIFLAYVFWWVNLILLIGPICGWLGAKDWNPPLVNIYAVTSILWFFFAVALFGWFLYLGSPCLCGYQPIESRGRERGAEI